MLQLASTAFLAQCMDTDSLAPIDNGSIGLSVCSAPFPAAVRAAESLGWTRDPFDRLIAAQAAIHDAPLITKDTALHEHYDAFIW